MDNKKIYNIRVCMSLVVFIATVFVIFGILNLKLLHLQIVPSLQRLIVEFSIGVLVYLIFLILVPLFFGRFYCSLICPLGLFQEFLLFLNKKKYSFKPRYFVKYFIAAIVLGTILGKTVVVARFIEPYSIFASAMKLSCFGLASLICIAILSWFSGRFFCTNICPVGTILGLLSRNSTYKLSIDENSCVNCGMCEKNCSASSIDAKNHYIDNETCVRCLKCVSTCSKNAISFKKNKVVEFVKSRRSFILTTSVVLAFIGSLKLGINYVNKKLIKIFGVILPPGAGSEKEFFHKCLNCNLCVQNCPTKVLKPADDNFGVVHIDYDGNYCEFGCNNCIQICPADAIAELSLEEKQSTQIAYAEIDNGLCINCQKCVHHCPVGAIYQKDESIIVNKDACIGCGRCVADCRVNAISIHSVSEQRRV
ncbi:MAG: 4Fe-4S binding protein [bacterium]|nr:4Fe-4S binding protein [bacterium]